ncbi:MAG: adenosine deaminase [Pseudomonadota bacterium]
MSEATGRDLRALPKAHLHLHLEGAMRRDTLASLCSHYGIALPDDTRGLAFDNFSGFLKVFWAACDVIRTRDDLARLIREVAEDAAAEGVWWLEPAFDAARYSTLRADQPHQLFASQEEGWLFALEAAEAASHATGVGIGFVSAIDRIMPLDHAMTRAEVTVDLVRSGRHRIEGGMPCHRGAYPGIVGFGLHGNEEGYPPEPFAPAFQRVRDRTDLLSVPHAGEIAPHPGGGPASVAAAIDHLGAQRIAHGVLAVEDDALVARLAAEQICLDVCPTSNLLLKVFPSVAAHPLPKLLAAGVPCTLGSDDPLLFGATLVDELVLCRERMGLDDKSLAAMARTSFARSGAPRTVKDAGLKAIESWMSRSE